MLGPLEVCQGDRQLRLGGSKQRSVLAVLLLDAGNVVSSDRLIEEVWGDDQPDDAATALQQHVARLRKLLQPHDVLRTRSRGYVLEIAREQLDLNRFEDLRDEGRRLLGAGRAAEASRTLGSALALWRGELLADLAGERFLRDARPRLEEARLDTLEIRIDADLAAGGHRELVGELRELVRAHPLRERFRAQLMLALYRAGRQAEALEVFADTRRTFSAELGLEPGPQLQRLQQAILTHDAALESPRTAPMPVRRRTALTAGIALALVVAAVAAALLLRGRTEDDPLTVTAEPSQGAVLVLDARTGSARRRIAAGRTPSAIAAEQGVAWIVDADARTVLRLASSSRVIQTFATGATPTDITAAGDAVWVTNGRPLEDAQFIGPVATSVARLDATTVTQRAETPLPTADGDLSNLVDNHLAATRDALWAITPGYAVVRIDAATGATTARSTAIRAAAIAAGPAGVWVLGVDGTVARLDARTARPTIRTRVPAHAVGSIAVGPDAAWVTSPADGTLWRVGADSPTVVGAIELGRGISDVAAGDAAVWVANPVAGTVIRIGPESGAVEQTVDLDGIPRSIDLDGDALWVALVVDPTASDVEVAGVRPFSASTCERVVAGSEESDLLVVSDLPLQGGVRITTTQMAQAIAFVFRERKFRAGRFRVAYQSCDDSVARTGLFDDAKCAANARAYAGNSDVVAVVGTFNSPCAVAALPELNRAPGGPLAMISPLNSFVGLTRTGPGVDTALPAGLYPTGRRNYLRVYPTDDLQGAALALVARDRGRKRVYVLDDGEAGYGSLMATGFETAARRVGLTVLGRATWDPQADDYAALADRVARARADAVFVGGLLDTNAARVIRDLRGRLRPTVDLLAPDGLTPLPLLLDRAGSAAHGTFVSLGGAVTERLPPAGADFVRRFGRTQGGHDVAPSAVYAAQAAEVLLDAIARSDGTRASVLEELFASDVRNGLLGTFRFNANGDITESPITILRVSASRPRSAEGGAIHRVVRPSPTLVAPSN